MLAEIASVPFDDANWIFEIKYDGYRAVANIVNGNVELYSRNLLSFNNTYKSIVEELKKINHDVILDGEIVIENEKGISSFQELQNYEVDNDKILKYYVFDILYLNGHYTTQLSLVERKELLKELLKNAYLQNIYYSEYIEKSGIDFFDAAKSNGLEGIIAKNAFGLYYTGKRSGEWLKIKIIQQQEVIIAGITEPKGGRQYLGALVLAVFENGQYKYVGNCGTGFSDKTLKELYNKLKPLFTKSSPFKVKIKLQGRVQWVKPKIVCEVKFSEWTTDKHMRHPVYLGLRKDKNATEVKREIPSTPKKSGNKKQQAVKKISGKTAEKNSVKKEIKSEGENEYDVKTGNITLHLTNQNKIYWPVEKYTKGELVKYYDSVAEYILPYLKDRPQSQHRFPNGINGPAFYQKDVDVNKIPSWLKTAKIFSESNKEYIDYLICNDKATLLYMANLGCIEINPWNSRIPDYEKPDWVVIDLDPEEISFKEVVKAALEVKNVFDSLEINSYCKTSGATGLHIYVPLAAKYDYDIAKTFAELIATTVNQKLLSTTSILRIPAKRKQKVYLDFLQNRRGQTLAAPYSVRPKPGAPVSTPLLWKEVNEKLNPAQFTIKTTVKRLEKLGDIWKPVIGKGENIEKAIKKLNRTG